MAKHKPETTEYMGQVDESTYQTGAIHPPKPGSSFITILLVLVIFLGGLCSTLGIVNVRLLSALYQTQQETTPLSLGSQPLQTDLSNDLQALDIPMPQVPENRSLSLQVTQSPRYEASENQITPQTLLPEIRQSLVTVQCLTYSGTVQTGVGLVLSSDGYLLTNDHLISEAKRIFVKLSDGTILRAALVGSDSFPDLAVLYVQSEDLTPAVFSSNDLLQENDPCFAVEPAEEDLQLRQSTVFRAAGTFAAKSGSMNMIQTHTGYEAGPVFNSFGHVIGFHVGQVAQYISGENCDGTGLVIPTATISQIVSSLVAEGQVNGRPHLGITVETISKVYQEYWQLPDGLLVTGVEENSDAEKSGLQEGDILISLDGVALSSRNDLYTTLYNHNIGDVLIAVVCRDDQQLTVKLTVEEN